MEECVEGEEERCCHQSMLTLTKEQSVFAKGIAILVMFAHHLYAFPDRFDHIWGHPYLIQLGRDLGIVVGLFVFLNGIGLTATREKLIKPNWGGHKLISVYLGFWKIAIPFLAIGFLFGYFEYDAVEVAANLTFWDSSYNHEWWYMKMYVEFLLLVFLLYRISTKWLLSLVTIITGIFAIWMQYHYGIPFPEKYRQIGGLLHYWPTFVLALNVFLWNLFDKVDGLFRRYVKSMYIRIGIYMSLAVLVHYYAPNELKFFQFFFYYMVICFIDTDNSIAQLLRFFGKHSMNMWLFHTFICYYYWQDWFMAISFNKWYLGLLNLTWMSLLLSILVNAIYKHLQIFITSTIRKR